ncbi:hypothetical protein ACVU7I_01325 [Patulibacter sp. S7RM1-6]
MRLLRTRTALAATIVGAGLCASSAHAAPADRAYELVSTGDQNGGEVRHMWPVRDGDTVAYTKMTGSPDAEASPMDNPTVAHRTANGWIGRSIMPRATDGPDSALWAYDPTFSRAVITSRQALGETALPGDNDLYSVDTTTLAATLLSKEQGVAPPGPGVTGDGAYVGASIDRRSVVFMRSYSGALLPEFVGVNQSMYRAVDGRVEPISVLSDGTPIDVNQLSTPREAYRGILAGSQKAPVANGTTHVVSTDGRRVYFDGRGAGGTQGLFLRDGNDRTVVLSRSRRSDASAGELVPARFIGATPDGSSAYFEASGPLLDGDVGSGIYRYQTDGDVLTRVTDQGVAALATSAWTSRDGRTLYFTSDASLTSDPAAGAPGSKVYVARDGALSLAVAPGGAATVERVSSDGRYAVLSSTANIGDVDTGGRAALYVLDREASTVTCASCRADGEPSQGAAALDPSLPNDFAGQASSPRGITDDGRLFFASTDALAPGSTAGVSAVYEYDGEQVRLLTPDAPSGAYLTDNTDDGSSAFVTTTDPLTPEDVDGRSYDIYAVRVGGGFPAVPAPAPCSGDACQGTVSPPPAVPGPSSSAPGAGNVQPPKDSDKQNRTRVSLSPIGAAAKRSLSRDGRVRVRVTVPGKGRVSITGRARIRGRSVMVARGSRSATKAERTTLSVTVRLTSAARRELRRKGRLRISLRVTQSGASRDAKRTITIKKATR